MTGLGAVFPQTEIEPDVGAIRTWVDGVGELGYDHVLVFDHVTGVDQAVHADFVAQAHRAGARSANPYDAESRFHEVMVLMGFLAGISELGLVSSVLVLPQRQTALVAKQAAEVSLLSNGRLRLGVGVGWNPIEYRSMGRDFKSRGRRIDAQIELLRRYWTEASVRHEGEDDWAVGVALAPRPAEPIPIWLAGGGGAKPIERVGRLADGWLPVDTDPALVEPQIERMRAAAVAAGRDPGLIGIEPRIDGAGADDPGRVAGLHAEWRRLGATHVAVNTMNAGLDGVEGHLAALGRVAEVVN